MAESENGDVLEQEDRAVSKTAGLKPVRVQIPPSPLRHSYFCEKELFLHSLIRKRKIAERFMNHLFSK